MGSAFNILRDAWAASGEASVRRWYALRATATVAKKAPVSRLMRGFGKVIVM